MNHCVIERDVLRGCSPTIAGCYGIIPPVVARLSRGLKEYGLVCLKLALPGTSEHIPQSIRTSAAGGTGESAIWVSPGGGRDMAAHPTGVRPFLCWFS